ncbi:MAG: NAD-dependent epimerase/dehydratase family protein [Dehalococcoidia bacterium]
MKALVTGATGFVGSYIVETLIQQGHEVRALARKTSNTRNLQASGVEIAYSELDDRQSLIAAVQGMDTVFHVAGKIDLGWGKWEDFQRVNVSGTRNMLDASSRAGVNRFIYVSSAMVYALDQGRSTPLKESAPLVNVCTPETYYGYSKRLAEQAVYSYQEEGMLDITVLRPDLIYGPRDPYGTAMIYRHLRFPIVFWPGKEGGLRCPIFAGDLAEFAVLAAQSQTATGRVYNVAPPEPIRYRDMGEFMIRAQGGRRLHVRLPGFLWMTGALILEGWARLRRSRKKPLFTRVDLKVFNQDVWIDGTRARRDLDWQPGVSLEQGFAKCVDWKCTTAL